MFFFFFFYFVRGSVTKNLVSEDEHDQMSISLCLFFIQETEPGYLFWQCLILLNGNWWTYLWQIKSIASLYTLLRTLKKPGSTCRLYQHINWIKINRFYLKKKKHNHFLIHLNFSQKTRCIFVGNLTNLIINKQQFDA